MRWAGTWVLVLLLGCPKKAELSAAELSLREAVVSSDTHWNARAKVGLDPVIESLDRVPAEVQEDPRLVWRRVRAMVSLGLSTADPLEARRVWTEARHRGVACHEGRRGGLALADDRAACAVWAAHAWVRWMIAFGGEAAAVDAEELQELVGYGGRGGYQNLADWAELLLDTHVLNEPEHTLRRRFDHLVDHAVASNRDDAWLRWADYARALPAHADAHRPGGTPSTPEAMHAVALVSE